MFTCSSCGYEANPDSNPACSLCGTKKPGAGASAVRTAPKPVGDDELANAAQAVADADSAPAPARASSAKGNKAVAPKGGGGAVAVQSSTGVLRLKEQPPEIANAATILGGFVGTVVGYAFAWHQVGHAPASFYDLGLVFLGAIVMALLGRFALGSFLDMRLDFAGRVAFAGPVSAAVGLGLFVFTIFAFWQGSRVATPDPAEAVAAGAVGTEGRSLAEHIALLTPWSVKLKGEKRIVLTKDGRTVEIPLAKLTPENVRDIQKSLGVPAAELDRLASEEPCPARQALPENFSVDRFVDQLGPVLGVQKDTTSKPLPGKILFTHRRSNGQDEALSLPEHPLAMGDLQPSVPKGTRLWIAVSLGLPPHAGAGTDHDQFVSETIDKYTPTN